MNLLLVPTAKEAAGIAHAAGLPIDRIQLCGFGPVAAAARAAGLIALSRPTRVYLAGIAGTYVPEVHPPGKALTFARVTLAGLGAGTAEAFIPAAQMGFPQWPGDATSARVADSVSLDGPDGELLTVIAASGDPAHARDRRARFPQAVAEDMEGFGVALACALARVPLTIIRGVSNVAGDRTISRWCIGSALDAAGAALREQLAASRDQS